MAQAHSDLRWWRDRRGDCLLHKPTRRIADSGRALRGRRSRFRQVGWFSGARLVPDLGAKLETICKKIKNDDDRHEAMSVARTLLSARENAQRCAVDCAPYVHAKLQAVHHEHGPTGRYLISDKPLTEEQWLKEVGATVIDVTPEDE